MNQTLYMDINNHEIVMKEAKRLLLVIMTDAFVLFLFFITSTTLVATSKTLSMFQIPAMMIIVIIPNTEIFQSMLSKLNCILWKNISRT